jgi:Kef-type K+ transport system membrane component KefB
MIDFALASPFNQLAALLILAGVLGAAAAKLRQPLILAFICVGILAGRDFLNIVGPNETLVGVLSDLGIALLLFMVGLQLDLGLLRTMGPVAAAAGIIQIAATALLGAGIALLCGMLPQTAVFCGVALAFSSTIIVVKLLSDRRDIDSLHGRISLGILIVQDLAVIVAIVVIAGLAPAGTEEAAGGAAAQALGIAAKMACLIAATGLFIRYAARPLTQALGRSPELMMICALALAAMAAGLCHHLGFGRELGGLLAGIALASTPARNLIAARLLPLRDFLLLFFFVNLGAQMNLARLGEELGPGLALSAFVLLGKPLIIMFTVGGLGYRKRTAFMSAVTLGQVSEFSLVFTAMGVNAGLASQSTLEIITLVTLITIGISAYAVLYSGALFTFIDTHIGLIERRNPHREETFRKMERAARTPGPAAGEGPDSAPESTMAAPHDVLIFGLGRYGIAMARRFLHNGISVLGIDFDPQAIEHARAQGVPACYGDAADAEFAHFLPLEGIKVVVFAFQHHLTNPFSADSRASLARTLRAAGFSGRIVSTSHFHGD